MPEQHSSPGAIGIAPGIGIDPSSQEVATRPVPAETGADDRVVAVAGSQVRANLATEADDRPHIVIVAHDWGSNWGEQAMATRMVAGALALSGRVSIVSLDTTPPTALGTPRLRYDGIFPVHSTTAPRGDTEQAMLLRASLARQPGAVMPEVAVRRLLTLESRPSSDSLVTIAGLAPDIVVLTGISALWLGEALPVGAARPRIVLLPLAGDEPALEAGVFRPLLGLADGIGTFSDGEAARIRRALSEQDPDRVHRLSIALPVNATAAASGLAGVSSFGQYVLVVSGFPDGDPNVGRCPPHDYLAQVLDGVSIAEIRHGRWLVSQPGRGVEVVFSPTRMNAWRLMARAIATIDVRPPGPIGRESVESLLLGTPVVVPEGSVAAEHAAASNGGLWYRNSGEMLDATRRIISDAELRDALASSGRSWAEQHHGDMNGFVEDVQRLVLGQPSGG